MKKESLLDKTEAVPRSTYVLTGRSIIFTAIWQTGWGILLGALIMALLVPHSWRLQQWVCPKPTRLLQMPPSKLTTLIYSQSRCPDVDGAGQRILYAYEHAGSIDGPWYSQCTYGEPK